MAQHARHNAAELVEVAGRKHKLALLAAILAFFAAIIAVLVLGALFEWLVRLPSHGGRTQRGD
jgi:cell division septal protein FtsQ